MLCSVKFSTGMIYHMSMTENQDKRGPNVKFPPPLIFIGAIILGYLMDTNAPLFKTDSYLLLLLGFTGIILCIGVLSFGLYSFLKAKTHIEPWQPASKLITTGLYQYSRNPLYLAFFVFTICIGLVMSNYWIVIWAFPALYVIQIKVVVKEEVYLERKFMDEYITYKRQVKRWF